MKELQLKITDFLESNEVKNTSKPMSYSEAVLKENLMVLNLFFI